MSIRFHGYCTNGTHENMYLLTSISIVPPPWKTKIYIYFLRGHTIFAIIFAFFVSFGFWSHYRSFLLLSSLSFKIRGFVNEPFEHLCCLTYSLLSSYVSRKQFPKENFVYCLWCCGGCC